MRALWLALLLLPLLAGCPGMAKWRDSQVAESHRLAKGSRIDPPATPIVVPDSTRRALPLDPGMVVVQYLEGSGSLDLVVLSPWDAEQTALWLLAQLNELGYDSGDNPSRILEGASYQKSGGRYPSLYVKQELNTADQTTVHFAAPAP